MTKFLCTKCSGFYDLDCILETNSPRAMPDRCPFGVIRFTTRWEVVNETVPEPMNAIRNELHQPQVKEH